MKVILHFDGDSFFASVEQVMDYTLKGKPVVTGRERGAITSASYEAKCLGIGRGVSIHDAKKLCPNLIIVPGDYLSYSIFAHRMYSIVREFTSLVDEYSIDECFADITGLDIVYKKSYEEIALMIKEKLEKSLGVTFGVGMAPNKVLAKVASKHRKPAGFTVISPENRRAFLEQLPAGKIWGIGASSSVMLSKLCVFTALEFAEKRLSWIEHHKIDKPLREIWFELQGNFVKELNLFPEAPKSIIKSRTFSPPSMNRDHIFSQLSKNIEAACMNARRHRLRAREIRFYLKTQSFTYKGYEISLPLATSSPTDIISLVDKYFNEVYRPNVLYRATGISMRSFVKEGQTGMDLFGDSNEIEKHSGVFEVVDKMAKKYGENSLYLGSSTKALHLSHSSPSKTIDLPFLGRVR